MSWRDIERRLTPAPKHGGGYFISTSEVVDKASFNRVRDQFVGRGESEGDPTPTRPDPL